LRRFPAIEFSVDAYRRFFEDAGWTTATLFSIGMGAAVMMLAVVIGAATAYGIVSAKAHTKRALSVLVLLPMIAPTIVFALAIYWLLAQIRLLGTFAGFVVANLVLALPYAVVTIRNGMEGLDRSLLRAASVLGARPARIIMQVVLPLLMPALAAGALFSFLIAFDEVVVAQFISGPHAVPLAKRMWDGILFRWDPAISAISTMQIAITLTILITLGLIRRKRGSELLPGR
jgi:putative spermidine/putrescine transport system permease protein